VTRRLSATSSRRCDSIARREEFGYSIVREFVGHGIGRAMHEPSSLPNHDRKGSGVRLKPGMALEIERMLMLLTLNEAMAGRDGSARFPGNMRS
jgi:methionine aminopeptidase